MPTRIRLGDPVSTSSPQLIEGWLSPDGNQIIVNVPSGDIRPDTLVTVA